MDKGECQGCAATIEVDAKTCPECGHSGKKSNRIAGGLLIGIGGLVSITVVGAIIGIPMILLGILLLIGSGKVSATGRAMTNDDDKAWWRKSFLRLWRERKAD